MNNDYSSRDTAGLDRITPRVVSPTKTEIAGSVAHSTDKDIHSSYAADEAQNQQQPQYDYVNVNDGLGMVHRQKLDLGNMLH